MIIREFGPESETKTITRGPIYRLKSGDLEFDIEDCHDGLRIRLRGLGRRGRIKIFPEVANSIIVSAIE